MKPKRIYVDSWSKAKRRRAERALSAILAEPVVFTYKPLTSVQMQIMYGR